MIFFRGSMISYLFERSDSPSPIFTCFRRASTINSKSGIFHSYKSGVIVQQEHTHRNGEPSSINGSAK